MSEGNTRPQYLSMDVKADSFGGGSVTIFGPPYVVDSIKITCKQLNSNVWTLGNIMKLEMQGECRFIEASFIEEVLRHGFEPLSDKQGHSHRFSRQMRK